MIKLLSVRNTRARAIAPLLALMLAAGCGKSEPLCQNNVIREAVSPDGQLKAVLFQRACGSTTGAASQVSIVSATATEAGKGNAFIADTAGNIAPVAAWGGPDIALEWVSPQELSLAYASRVRAIIAPPSVRGVTITHKIKD